MRRQNKSYGMPPVETKRRNKVFMANKGTNSTQNGRQSPYFTIGGHGMKPHEDKKSLSRPFGWERCESPWNAGKCFPSKKFKRI